MKYRIIQHRKNCTTWYTVMRREKYFFIPFWCTVQHDTGYSSCDRIFFDKSEAIRYIRTRATYDEKVVAECYITPNVESWLHR